MRSKNAILRSLVVPEGRCVGGVGCGGVSEDDVEIFEVTELVCGEVAGVVAAELCRHVGSDGKDGVFWADCRVSEILLFEEHRV